MLHELLFALAGYTGDVFVLDPNDDILVAKNLPFVHPTEESTLNKLCVLGKCYLKLKSFIEETSNYFNNSIGLYKRSFAKGLELCLEPYQKLIIDLEKELITDPYLTFSHVVARTEEYQLIFPSLVKLAEEVAHNKVHGCAIIDLLYKATICGMPPVRKAILKILHTCHCTMYKQMTSWMLHGMLYHNDRFKDEFFICFKERDAEITVAEGSSKYGVYKEPEMAVESIDINVEMLPGHISLKNARKMLFIGRSVMIFESSQNGKEGSSIMKNKEEEFMTDINKLSVSCMFDPTIFEETIDKIRTYVSQQLWKLMVSQSDLQMHLRNFKDFFLIGRGELFLAFIDQSQEILRNPPIIMTQHDVNVAFHHAARDIFLSEDTYQRFKFVIEESHTTLKATKQHKKALAPTTFLNIRESGWNCLRMEATVDWPLHVMFTPNVIKKYSKLFSFLLYVKRIQLELQHCWSIEMNRRHMTSFRRPNKTTFPLDNYFDDSKLKWQLRNHMAFLVDNFQYYLQVDVIESQYCLLLEKIKTKKDFEEITLAHEYFLTSLHNQCFFHSKQINNCLSCILDLCHAFYGLMTYSENVLSQAQHTQLQELAKEFELQSSLLFMLLSSFKNNQTSNPHLAQLLLRIDYNKFFSSAQQPLNTRAVNVLDK